MPAAAISTDDLRLALTQRHGQASWAAGDDPDWLRELIRQRDWHLASRHLDHGDGYGDQQDGHAHVSVYAHGDRRVEVASYPERHVDWDRELWHVTRQWCAWTVEIVDGEDVGLDLADYRYEIADEVVGTLAEAQALAAHMDAADESERIRASNGRL